MHTLSNTQTTLSGMDTAWFAVSRHLSRSTGRPLDAWIQRLLEQAFGRDLSDLRIHADAEADRLTRAINALAFTTGGAIFFRADLYDPASWQGLYLLAHEVTHAVQQASMCIEAEADSLVISDPGDPFEHAAEASANYIMGHLAQLGAATRSYASHRLPLKHPHHLRLRHRPKIIQCAIGLEIEIPIPIDKLTAAEVINLMNEIHLGTTDPNPATRQGHRINAVGMRDTLGTVTYGTIQAAANGFRVDADHDDRVTTPNPLTTGWPFHEGSRDSIMELVMQPPALNLVQFNATMVNITAFINTINANTINLVQRWANAFPALGAPAMPLPVSVGPLSGMQAAAMPYHNVQGSIQVNLGIDLRELDNFFAWYVASPYANHQNAPTPAEQNLHIQIQADIQQAVAAATSIITLINTGGLPAAPLAAQTGNLKGLRGWITYLALYLKRGTIAHLGGGSPKNIIPILVKSPNAIITQYGMTPAEIGYFTANRAAIMNQIFQFTGRAADVGQPLNAVDVFASLPGQLNAATLSNVAAAVVPLTGGPINNPTGVGPTRMGNLAVQNLPAVPVAPGNVGGGPNTRGGMVIEIRNIPGFYNGPAAWSALGQAFWNQALLLNAKDGVAP